MGLKEKSEKAQGQAGALRFSARRRESIHRLVKQDDAEAAKYAPIVEEGAPKEA